MHDKTERLTFKESVLYLEKPNKSMVVNALNALRSLPANTPTDVPLNQHYFSSAEDQNKVAYAETLAKEYVWTTDLSGVIANSRSVTELNKSGFRVYIDPNQYPIYGDIEIGPWFLVI